MFRMEEDDEEYEEDKEKNKKKYETNHIKYTNDKIAEEEDQFYKTYLFKPPPVWSPSKKKYSSSLPLCSSISKERSSPLHNLSSSLRTFSIFDEYEGGTIESFPRLDRDESLLDFPTWKSIVKESIHQLLFGQKYIPKKTIQIISRHPYTPLAILEEYPFVRWEYTSFYDHPQMTQTFIYNFQAKYRKRVFLRTSSLGSLGRLPNSPFHKDFHKENNNSLSLQEKKKLSYSSTLPLSLVLHNPDPSWDYPFLLLYRKWTIDQLDRLLNSYRIPWKQFSRNYFLTFDILYHFLDKPWDWKLLATHPRFSPDLILLDPILFPRWNWKHAYKHPRMTISVWNYLRKAYKQPFHSSFLLANSFQYSSELRMYSYLLIQNWIRFHRWRYTLDKKRKYLCNMIHILPYELVIHTLSFL
uniref:Uncharacterized protein n=1 Tax=viral metagenome TaxID=1070528 RepID=A0A6C0D129_9ZZZZ